MDRPTRVRPINDGRLRARGDLHLVRAAIRRRPAERALEDHVREIARRWTLRPDRIGAGGGEPLSRV